MKNILIPTDFSDNSHNAIRYALEYFENIAVNFFILHVSQKKNPIITEVPESFPETMDGTVSEEKQSFLLAEEIKFCQSLTQNPSHKFHSVQGDRLLVESIRKQITQKEIDMIVMGTKGGSKTSQDEMGSHTYDVITKVKCPIMVIPENAKFNRIRNIAFMTDYNCIYRNRVISTLSEALHLHKSPLRVLHIRPQNTSLNSAQTDNKGFLHYFFREVKHSFHFLENKNLEPGIQDFIDTWDISMVGIVAKNLNFIQRLMMRPTGGINYHTEVPFLVLHE